MTSSAPRDFSSAVYSAWLRATDPGTGPTLRTSLPVPTALSVRGRYELLLSGPPSGFDASAFQMPPEVWSRQIELLDLADRALKDNDLEASERHFEALRSIHEPGLHPAALVEAEIGLGDTARQADDVDAAIAHYASAIRQADECGYRFASVRARIPLGYLNMRSGSVRAARDEFEAVAAIARSEDWRIDLANALTGLGEAHQRLREPTPALRALLEALGVFDGLRSAEGVANAALHLGELARRQNWVEDAIGWYGQAVAAAEQSRMQIALANALDGLAEVELASGDHDAAVRDHERAFAISGEEYPRGQAHALNGLARCAFADGDWEGSARYFAMARDRYLELGDLVSVAHSHAGLARCAEERGAFDQAVRHRLDAVFSIEPMRAAQTAHAYQAEYFERFGGHHAAAIRTAVAARDLEAFVAVFESIAGRRLAGLITQAAPSGTADARLLSQLLLETNSRAWPPEVAEAGGDRLRRRTIALGRLALRSALPPMASQAFDTVVAGLYAPFDPGNASELWARADTGGAHLLLMAVLHDEGQLAWLLRPASGPVHIGLRLLPEETRSLIDDLYFHGLPLDAAPSHVAALRALLPAELVEQLPEGEPLVIVPAERLWGVPWPAVPFPDGAFLGERHPVTISPSLTAVAHTSGSAGPVSGTAGHWVSPLVRHHGISAFGGDPNIAARPVGSADAARSAILRSADDLFVVVAHGKPVRELVHYLELDAHVALTPADMLTAEPPSALVLISCWGAHAPQADPGDPMTIATIALARGAGTVAATLSELYDDPASSSFVNMFLHGLTDAPMSVALHRATRTWLRRPEYRNDRLSRWAPLVVLGSRPSTEEPPE